MDKKITLGITGGPATGKSLVTKEFSRLGAIVVDADIIAREVLTPGRAEFTATVAAFGQEILSSEGTIDRKALGAIVFSDYARLAELTAITHPAIIRAIRESLSEFRLSAEGKVLVLDAPLLFEAGLAGDVDKIIVVFTDEAVQVKRLMKRDGLDEAGALSRAASQMPLAEKKRRAHYLIDNNGPPEDTLAEVRTLYKSLILEMG